MLDRFKDLLGFFVNICTAITIIWSCYSNRHLLKTAWRWVRAKIWSQSGMPQAAVASPTPAPSQAISVQQSSGAILVQRGFLEAAEVLTTILYFFGIFTFYSIARDVEVKEQQWRAREDHPWFFTIPTCRSSGPIPMPTPRLFPYLTPRPIPDSIPHPILPTGSVMTTTATTLRYQPPTYLRECDPFLSAQEPEPVRSPPTMWTLDARHIRGFGLLCFGTGAVLHALLSVAQRPDSYEMFMNTLNGVFGILGLLVGGWLFFF